MSASGISELNHLSIVLENDKNNLRTLARKLEQESDLADLINSIVSTKETILQLIPGANKEATTSPAPPISNQTYYHPEYHNSSKDGFLVLSEILEVERGQMELVKTINKSGELPQNFHDPLKDILKIYAKVTEQLTRAKKTNQINSIVI